ncbi:MAG TPA: hypothetical protein VK625_13785, partial [Flavitalea sp.]|nr:hypothetical protein [Flavitalea sp.]
VRKLTSYSISILGRPRSGQVKHMQYLSKDIERKFKRTGDHINVGKLLKLVPVEVATVDTASKPVSNLNVHYTSIASKIDYNFPEYTFQNLTSPASEGMVPGLYMMWVTRGNDRRPLSEKMVDVDPAKSNKIRMPVRYAP